MLTLNSPVTNRDLWPPRRYAFRCLNSRKSNVLAEPDRTQFDLHFRLFGFHVRIHPWFWLGTALFGSNTLSNLGPQFFLAWIAIVFLSILIHELGHAFAFRRFGVDSHIVLHGFGGLAIPWSRVGKRWQRILVSLAGPLAGFLLAGIVLGSHLLTGWGTTNGLAMWVFVQLMWVNVIWGLMNLLPVWPLDGGQVCEEVCSRFSSWRGRERALQISMVTAGAMCLYSLFSWVSLKQGAEWLLELPWWFPLGSIWTAILFGLLAVQSYQLIQQAKWQGSHWDQP